VPIAMVSSSGHIHIPRAIREHLGIQPGDKVQLRVLRDGRVVIETDLTPRGNWEDVKSPAKQVSSLDTGVNWSGD
jgi:AbrB family looped-hinge helix DNA binding protein